jgi:hypothetical protein
MLRLLAESLIRTVSRYKVKAMVASDAVDDLADKRFRSAIASSVPTDFASLYGTFYGAYRFGGSGDPRAGRLLRMLQFERGVYQFAMPPWLTRNLYVLNSPISCRAVRNACDADSRESRLLSNRTGR